MNRLKVKIANYILKHLFNTVIADDILVYNPNDKTFQVAGKTLPAGDKQDIISGARSIKNMYVWKMINKDMKYQANKLIYEKSKNVDDILFGKAMLYTLDVVDRKLENLSEKQ